MQIIRFLVTGFWLSSFAHLAFCLMVGSCGRRGNELSRYHDIVN